MIFVLKVINQVRSRAASANGLHPNFGEDPKGEVRRIRLPRTPVNKGKKKGRGLCYAPVLRKRRSSLVLCRFSLAAPSLVVYLEEPHLLLQAGCGPILVEPVASHVLGYRAHNGLVGRSPP